MIFHDKNIFSQISIINEVLHLFFLPVVNTLKHIQGKGYNDN